VRTTDLVESLPAVLAQLEAEQPDVLLLQTTRESPVGRRGPAPRQTGLDDASPEIFDKVFGVSWCGTPASARPAMTS